MKRQQKSSENSICFYRLLQFLLTLFNKLSIETNSVDPDQTAPIFSIIWVYTVCWKRLLTIRLFDTMDYPRFVLANQREELISTQRV